MDSRLHKDFASIICKQMLISGVFLQPLLRNSNNSHLNANIPAYAKVQRFREKEQSREQVGNYERRILLEVCSNFDVASNDFFYWPTSPSLILADSN